MKEKRGVRGMRRKRPAGEGGVGGERGREEKSGSMRRSENVRKSIEDGKKGRGKEEVEKNEKVCRRGVGSHRNSSLQSHCAWRKET